jgi:hypothetical protein
LQSQCKKDKPTALKEKEKDRQLSKLASPLDKIRKGEKSDRGASCPWGDIGQFDSGKLY